ncbi:hypothetical protein BV898_17706 [Hypsibius exemplaris]|uniref:VWFA domain-containing protein n=1 Tax=Hypsibius exemplaris TaxID=2072580 RepID=A0A9X6RMS1_HYPEX|nr:hypothetical protein BV898_17706 [Hypsibius exemplaris]
MEKSLRRTTVLLLVLLLLWDDNKASAADPTCVLSDDDEESLIGVRLSCRSALPNTLNSFELDGSSVRLLNGCEVRATSGGGTDGGTDGRGTDGGTVGGTDGRGTDGGTDGRGTVGGTDGRGTDGRGTDGGTDGRGTDGRGTDGWGTDGQTRLLCNRYEAGVYVCVCGMGAGTGSRSNAIVKAALDTTPAIESSPALPVAGQGSVDEPDRAAAVQSRADSQEVTTPASDLATAGGAIPPLVIVVAAVFTSVIVLVPILWILLRRRIGAPKSQYKLPAPLILGEAFRGVEFSAAAFVDVTRRFRWTTLFVVVDSGSLPSFTTIADEVVRIAGESGVSEFTNQRLAFVRRSVSSRNLFAEKLRTLFLEQLRTLLLEFRSSSRVMIFLARGDVLREMLVLNESKNQHEIASLFNGYTLSRMFLNRTFRSDLSDIFIDSSGNRRVELVVSYFDPDVVGNPRVTNPGTRALVELGSRKPETNYTSRSVTTQLYNWINKQTFRHTDILSSRHSVLPTFCPSTFCPPDILSL